MWEVGALQLHALESHISYIVTNSGVGGSFGMKSAIQPTNPRGVGGSPWHVDSALSKSVMKRTPSVAFGG